MQTVFITKPLVSVAGYGIRFYWFLRMIIAFSACVFFFCFCFFTLRRFDCLYSFPVRWQVQDVECGIRLYRFLIIAFSFTFKIMIGKICKEKWKWKAG